MKPIRRIIVSVVAVGIILNGCYRLTHNLVPFTSLPEDVEYEYVRPFKIRTQWSIWYAIYGLVPVRTPSIEDLIREEIGGDPALRVINLKIRTEYSFLNAVAAAVLGSVTFGLAPLIWTPWTLEITGDVVRVKK